MTNCGGPGDMAASQLPDCYPKQDLVTCDLLVRSQTRTAQRKCAKSLRKSRDFTRTGHRRQPTDRVSTYADSGKRNRLLAAVYGCDCGRSRLMIRLASEAGSR